MITVRFIYVVNSATTFWDSACDGACARAHSVPLAVKAT